MVQQLQSPQTSEIIYPESDGQPMGENTTQFRWITIIVYNLAWLFTDDPMVFIAGDLFWYPVEGHTEIFQAPDVLVVFGRPKGDRGSYVQHREEDIPPQVVFEIRSPSNTQTEMDKKLVFYDNYGVEEYYLYDPQKNDLSGWLRCDGKLNVIEQMNGWRSPRLNIRFDLSGEELQLYRPDGTPFLSYEDVQQRLVQVEQRLGQTQQQLGQTERELGQTQRELELERQQAQQERQRADLAEQQVELERQKAQQLEQLLLEAGIDPNQI